MDEHAKIKRILSIILLLMGSRRYSKSEIMQKFKISDSTFYRYISSFKEAGLIVEQENGLYHIRRKDSSIRELWELLHFSEEEALILNKAIDAIDDNNQLKANLRKKLYSIYDFDRIAEAIVHPEQAQNIQRIMEAIKNHKQILLVGYQSAHGHSISNRLVEAFDITANYQMIWAYDIGSKKNKQFKVSRVQEVVVKQEEWRHEELHQALPMDVFRISGAVSEECILNLNLRAGNLLLEEYPLAEKYLEKTALHAYQFKGPIYGYQGVGRFCMGLIEDVEMIQPQGLKDYIQDKIKKFTKKNTSLS
jgi:predicted DNA-binding transcriptional regulator YafY